MIRLLSRRPVLRENALRRRYDVVVVGGGGHGLSTAYNLAARHNISNVAVFERDYIGAGATGRNTTVIRANYMTAAAVPFYRKSVQLYKELSVELDFNLLRSERGTLDVVHSQEALNVERRRSLVNRELGVETRLVTREEIKELCPLIDLEAQGRPIIGGSYHPVGAIARHDAVVWGYASAAQRLGVHVHQGITVTGIRREGGRCVGVDTTAGPVDAGAVVSAVASETTRVAATAGVRLPIVTQPLQAFVTIPYRPVLDVILGSVDLLVYISQSARGELLVGAEVEPYQSYSTKSTLGFLAHAAARSIQLLPFMRKLRLLRQWTGLCDLTPDDSPIMDATEVDGFYINGGWGTWGFKAIPAAGLAMADLVATGSAPELIRPFSLARFARDQLVSERSSSGTH